ncbi:MAG: LacI family DNA-binding transcriptional regulator [Anaerorhabdus sp.]
MKRVTIYDVAKDADVSLATVSRVINGSDVVKANTREKVEASIERLGYKPNAIAQGLALQKTTTIGLVIPEASFTYTGQIINGVIAVAGMYNYKILLHTTAEGVTEIKDVVESIIKSNVDGVVIYNDKLLLNEIDMLSKYNIPIVIIGNKISNTKVSSVYVNIEKAIYNLVTSYLENGKKDIAIIQDRKNKYAIEQMISGANKAFEDKGLKFNNYLKIPDNYRTSYEFLKDYLKQHKHQLIIANRDSQAMAILNAASENGINVPEETEVVCVIDTKYNSMVRPQVSSFSIPSYDLGMVSMRVMTKMLLEEEEIQDKEIELSYLYTPRKSTK